MRVLMVSQDFPPEIGGIQSYALELARRLAPRVERLLLVAPRVRGSVSFDASAGFEIVRSGWGSDTLAFAGLAALPRIARRMRADVAFHAQWQTVVGSLAAQRWTGRPLPIVVAAHGRELLLDPLRRVPRLQRGFDRLRSGILQRADAVLPVSGFTGNLVAAMGVPPAKIHVVNNGVDAATFGPVDASDFVRTHGIADRRRIVTVGRLVRRKGIDTMLLALPAVLERIPDALYVVAGSGPDRARLEAMARDLGVAEHVRFLGSIPAEALCACYSSAEIFVTAARHEHPSVEGFGLVFLEAGACGVPVIGTRSGGIPDAIVDGETGLLVPPEDPGGLARAVLRLLEDIPLARRMGERARQRALDDASWDRTAAQVLAVLQSLYARTSASRERAPQD